MRINEKGRSMIEMLGVLAIIGVLSVGGIAGYSKAMAKFRANKTIDLISHTVANTRILFGSQSNYADLGTFGTGVQAMAVKAKLFPDEVVKTTSTTTGQGDNAQTTTTYSFTNAYAGDVKLLAGSRLQGAQAANTQTNTAAKPGDNKAFIILLTGVPQSACIDLATQDWSASSGSGFVGMMVAGADSGTTAPTVEAFDQAVLLNSCTSTASTQTTGDNPTAISSATICSLAGRPMTTLIATAGCSGVNFNNMYFKFY